MKLLILGATGGTGALLTAAALRAGHEVTALVRDPGRLAGRPGLRAVRGDVRDPGSLAAAADGAEALVSCLGVGNTRDPHDLIRDTARAVVAAAARTGLRRVVFQSALGVGASYPRTSVLMRLGYRLAPAVFRDKAAGEDLLAATGLDWTVVYPGMLTNGPRTGRVTATGLDTVTRLPGLPRISRADVAEFLLGTATTGTWNRQIAVITAKS
ncbi:NAD(P)-dependent oxidoreductase [Catenuloplanes japonicus]|uniref:NAD(P)-dependent oxidoreductase n=1 Tax=Catenuloplanes japonicus TaxID=33876 RepID=UPI0005261733|nr:NAD(P)H-binding protein [Catenuloplanes japonicus]